MSHHALSSLISPHCLFFSEDGYKDLTDYMEPSIIPILAVLLVFSVVGSVYVFRGYWVIGLFHISF